MTSSRTHLAASGKAFLSVDDATLADLAIFATGADSPSVFRLCNRTRLDGGAAALRRRMCHPWADPDCIRATQLSVVWILDNRSAFEPLNGLAYTIERVREYLRGSMPMVSHRDGIGLWMDAYAIWSTHDRHYAAIARGVRFTCRFVRAMRNLVGPPGRERPPGEIGELVHEMRALLVHPELADLSGEGPGGRPWRILRLDRSLRQEQVIRLERLMVLAHEVDALVAMADATREHGFALAEIDSGELALHADDVFHPLVDGAVGNPVRLDASCRMLFLTGPNMAGKSTYLRAFGVALFLAHLGMGVPARRLRFVPATHLFSTTSLSDDLSRGISYFRAEALRVREVAEAVARGSRVVAVMDEPFKGTNVKDALDASLAILSRLATRRDCLFMVSSHLIELEPHLTRATAIGFGHFRAIEHEARMRFDFRLRPGVSSQRLGMRVLEEEGIFTLLDDEPDRRGRAER